MDEDTKMILGTLPKRRRKRWRLDDQMTFNIGSEYRNYLERYAQSNGLLLANVLRKAVREFCVNHALMPGNIQPDAIEDFGPVEEKAEE